MTVPFDWSTVPALAKEAARRMDCPAGYDDFVEVYSFPAMFANTSGPHHRIGGQALTTFQAFLFGTTAGMIKYCDGVWKRFTGPWEKAMQW